MKIEKVSAAASTITFSRKEILLLRSVINETANGLHLNASQRERLGRTRERENDLWEELRRVFDAK